MKFLMEKRSRNEGLNVDLGSREWRINKEYRTGSGSSSS